MGRERERDMGEMGEGTKTTIYLYGEKNEEESRRRVDRNRANDCF